MSYEVTSHVLVIPRLRVQNANAISSPLTHGFPSMTAFLGLMWALERKLKQAGLELPLNAVGVVCHDHQELVTGEGFVKTFRLTRNPLDRTGKTAAIVEEGRIHLEISLVFNTHIEEDSDKWSEKNLPLLMETLNSMRVAGGSLLPPEKPWLQRYQPRMEPAGEFAKIFRRLLPGFALVERHDLLEQRYGELLQQKPDSTKLDALLSLSRINWQYQQDEEGKGAWQHDRTGLGWVVPIPVGYGALGELHPAGAVPNARDQQTPFRFVESLYSIGQWIAPHRLTRPEQFFWFTDSQPDEGLYRCRNQYTTF